MRICLVANGYPQPQDPQWGCFERDQAFALKKAGHDVYVIALDTRYREYKRHRGVRCLTENGLNVYWGYWFPTGWIKRRNIRDRVHSFLFDIVFRKARDEKGVPDIIFAHFQRNIFLSYGLKIKYGIPVVGMEHWSVLMKKILPETVLNRGRVAYKNVDKLLSVSIALSNKIYDHFGVRSEVVHDMLGPEFLDFRQEDSDVSVMRFIAVGSLLPIKGFDILIKAFNVSGLAEKNCKLTIVGEGPERVLLESLIKQNDLTESVTLAGRKNKEEIVEYLHNNHVFVLSSRSETFGVVCIEALSQGLPNVATRCGGTEEFINSQNGILVAPDNVEELSKALQYMHENYFQYDRSVIARNCLNDFSPVGIASKLTILFEEVIHGNKERKI